MQVPFNELESRMFRFRSYLDKANPEWEMAVIFGKINLFYFTGTMQEGMLLIPRNEEAIFWVRRSFDRAIAESLFPVIRPMDSYRDAAAYYASFPKTIHLESEVVPIAMLQRFQKYFPFSQTMAADGAISYVRSVKSEYELNLMKESGRIHQRVLEERVPLLLKQGISEASFGSDLYTVLIEEGHHGVARFGMFDTEIVLGHIAFGESSIYPTSFNGPGGNYGMSAAVPALGSRQRLLKKGDLVFVDVACGVDGYHTDKTVIYMFGEAIPAHARDEHQRCLDIQNEMASMLKPGAIPSEIYQKTMEKLPASFLENFMGFGNRQVKFLGHGIGLTIDESPVIAKGFNEPIQEGMVFALEPKKGIPHVGMVGIENTFLVTPDGGMCITGNNPGLIPVFE